LAGLAALGLLQPSAVWRVVLNRTASTRSQSLVLKLPSRRTRLWPVFSSAEDGSTGDCSLW